MATPIEKKRASVIVRDSSAKQRMAAATAIAAAAIQIARTILRDVIVSFMEFLLSYAAQIPVL